MPRHTSVPRNFWTVPWEKVLGKCEHIKKVCVLNIWVVLLINLRELKILAIQTKKIKNVMSIILHYCCSLVWNMGLFTSAQLFNAGRNSRQTHLQFLVYRKKSLTFLIFDVGQLIFRDCKAGMVPSTLGMCRYISHSEIVGHGPKKFENPWVKGYLLYIRN